MKNFKLKEIHFKILFLALMFVLALIWSVTQYYGAGPDEQMKMQVISYVANHNALPHGGDAEIIDKTWGTSYGFTPILTYIISAVFMNIAQIFTDHQPYLIVAARFVSVILFTASIAMIIKIAGKLFKNAYKWLFIIATSCLPGFVFLGTYLNNDILAVFASTIIIYSWILGLEKKWDVKSCIILAIGLGLCALSYYNAYGFILTSMILFFASYFIDKNNKKIDIKDMIKKGAIVASITFLIAGWWFVRSAVIYDGDFLGLNISNQYAQQNATEQFKPSNLPTPENQGLSFFEMLINRGWIRLTIQSFIGVFGLMTIFMSPAIYYVYYLIFALAFLGIIIYFINNIKNKTYKKDKPKLLIEIMFILNIVIPTCLSLYYSYFSDFQPQGRYIMPMILPFAYFVTVGIKTLLEKTIRKEKIKNIDIKNTITILITVVLVILLIYSVVGYIIPTYK